MNSDNDVVKVLNKDGMNNINWKMMRKYENNTSINLKKIYMGKI